MPRTLSITEERFDLRAYLRAKFRPRDIEKYGNEWAVPCPDCDGDHRGEKAHLYVNVERKVGVCYRCRDEGAGGCYNDLPSLISALERISYMSALMWLKDRSVVGPADLKDALDRLRRRQEVAEEDEEEQKVIPLPFSFQPAVGRLPKLAASFYARRGITESDRRTYGIGYTTRGYYAGRSVVPVVLHGKRWTWVGRDLRRAIGKEHLPTCDRPDRCVCFKKVVYPKGSKTGRLLFNYDRAATYPTIVLVEGVYDAIRVGAAGCGTFGTALSEHQIELLVQANPHTVVIMWDEDAEASKKILPDGRRQQSGYEKSLKVGTQLLDYFPRVKVARITGDPDDHSRRDLWRSVRETPLLSTANRLRAAAARLSGAA